MTGPTTAVAGRGSSGGTAARPARARRLRAPSWRDPRLLVGVALVLGSVVLGARTVQAAGATTGVWAVAAPVGAGSSLTAAQLRVVQVSLDAATGAAYLPAAEPPAAGWIALRGLSAGELLPRSAVAPAVDLVDRAVSLPLEGALPEGVRTGALADVWVVWPADTGAAAAGSLTGPVSGSARPGPEELAQAVEVVAVRQRSSALAGAAGADVEVLVPGGVLPSVLRALAVEADVVLVPVPGSAGAGS
ncbi:SAF domain-containing protein [Kineococcus sp. G2]|uniref:SAF domain-containing protein n=1 Tax=Kineococcus sp. G2 TaxID=3127484 RepID=UPI00301DCE47